MKAEPTSPVTAQKEPTRRMLAEAAAWLARLHRSQRQKEDEAGFRRWLGECPEHQRAWELASEMWETAQRIPLSVLGTGVSTKEAAKQQTSGWLKFALVPFAIGVISLAWLQWGSSIVPENSMATNVGEQRLVTLDDGSRVSLNTSTQVAIEFTPEVRRVRLLEGEAFFEVAKNKHRPFIVQVNDREITAVGTSFVVRRDEKNIEVTLVEGQVIVSQILGLQELLEDLPPPRILDPGQRLTLDMQRDKVIVDRPVLNHVTAWQRGVSIFDNTPLKQAVSEMNRYSRDIQLSVVEEVGELPVSGVFRVGDSLSFALAVSQAYGLSVTREDSGDILLRPDKSSRQ